MLTMTDRGAAYIITPMMTHTDPTTSARPSFDLTTPRTRDTKAPYNMLITASSIDIVFCIFMKHIRNVVFAANKSNQGSQNTKKVALPVKQNYKWNRC